MAKDIHKGIVLDDKFSDIMLDIQKNIDKLYALAKDFEKQDHTSTTSQIDYLSSAKGYLGDLIIEFKDLRTVKSKSES